MRVLTGAVVCGLFIVQPAFAAKNDADALLAASKAAEHAGEHGRAERLAQAAIVADPARASSYTALGDLYLHGNQSDFASFYYDEALAIDPSDPAARHGLALAGAGSKAESTAESLDKNPHDQ